MGWTVIETRPISKDPFSIKFFLIIDFYLWINTFFQEKNEIIFLIKDEKFYLEKDGNFENVYIVLFGQILEKYIISISKHKNAHRKLLKN